MIRYVALLRGIGPSDPNMANENLRRVCEDLGLDKVQTVISSGNVLFETDSADTAKLEQMLEVGWREQLGFESTTILRSQRDLEKLVEHQPFGDLEHGPSTYLLVTFARSPLSIEYELPHQPADRDYTLIGATDRELFTVTDTTAARTPDAMSWLENNFGNEITSRTWLTVLRILKRMQRVP